MNDEQLLDAFAELIKECVPESRGEIEALLVESGFNLAQLDLEIEQLMESLKCGARDQPVPRGRQAAPDSLAHVVRPVLQRAVMGAERGVITRRVGKQ